MNTTQCTPISTRKVDFVNILRGLCALVVVFQHYFHDFWIYKDMIYDIQSITVTKTPEFAEFLEKIHFNFGHCAVYTFFIISGFVIPISVERYNKKEFLIQRFFRIYPTYIVCSAISYIGLYIYNSYENIIFAHQPESIIANLLLLRDVFLYEGVLDIVSWTLQLEIKFYITVLLLYKSFKNLELRKLLIYLGIVSIIGIICIYAQKYIGDNYRSIQNKSLAYNLYIAFYNFNYYAKFLQLFSIGVCLYLFFRRKISQNHAIGYSLSMIIMFGVLSKIEFTFTEYDIHRMFSIAQAIVAFALFFGLLMHTMKKETKITDHKTENSIKFEDMYKYNNQSIESKSSVRKSMDWLADISYSLYLAHPTIGLIILNIFDNVAYGILVAFLYSFLMAIIIHKFIEKPSLSISKILISKSF